MTTDPNTVIDQLGGTSETARLCDVSPASVSEWRKNGIPHARLMFLKLARPDVFDSTGTQSIDEAAQAPHLS